MLLNYQPAHEKRMIHLESAPRNPNKNKIAIIHFENDYVERVESNYQEITDFGSISF